MGAKTTGMLQPLLETPLEAVKHFGVSSLGPSSLLLHPITRTSGSQEAGEPVKGSLQGHPVRHSRAREGVGTLGLMDTQMTGTAFVGTAVGACCLCSPFCDRRREQTPGVWNFSWFFEMSFVSFLMKHEFLLGMGRPMEAGVLFFGCRLQF